MTWMPRYTYRTGGGLVKLASIFSRMYIEFDALEESLGRYNSFGVFPSVIFAVKTVSLYFIFICWIVDRSANSS